MEEWPEGSSHLPILCNFSDSIKKKGPGISFRFLLYTQEGTIPFKMQVQVKRGKEREARRNSPLTSGGIQNPDSQSFQWNKIHRAVNDHKSVSLKLETRG